MSITNFRTFGLLLLATISMWTSGNAFGEEWGFTFGGHVTSAEARQPGESVNSRFGTQTGFLNSWFFSPSWKLRTGLIYDERYFDVVLNGASHAHRWEYLDVPAILQFNLTPMIGFFAGPVLGMNQSVLVVGQAGVNFIFDNMWGFDFYYEQGFAPMNSDAEHLSALGISLDYYFL